MSTYDLAIRGGTVVTAADVTRCDIGIKDGRIAVLSGAVTDAARTIDATGLLVMPGGIDSHVHLAQPSGDAVMADGFESGTASAAAGGNTTVIPFAVQPRGASLRESVVNYHKEADGKALVDYGFHLIITDPSASVLGQELPALVGDGYTSFKVFMTYDDMVLNDRQLLEVFDCARREKALVMVHCEGYDAIKFMTERLEAAGKTAPYYHAVSRPAERRARGGASRHLARRADRRSDHDRPRLGPRGDGADPLGAAARPQGLWRDLHAVHLAHRRRPQGHRHGRDRRQICLLAAAARPRELGRDLGGHPDRRVPDLLVRPLPVPLRQPAGQAARPRAARPSAGCPTAFPASRCACPCCSPRAW